MTTGEQLDNISTVTNVSTLIHLLNPSGEGGGGDVIINSEIKTIGIRGVTGIKQVDDAVGVTQGTSVKISRVTENIGIITKTGDEINVVC